MSWATRRRIIILLILGAVGIALLAILSITVFYKAPSCSDGIQNQDETGIDCGGSCPYLCTAQVYPPTVLFTKALLKDGGRTDIIASIENVNAGVAAKDVPYTVTLYGAGQVLVQQVTGTLDLPPSTSVPVFIPGIPSGNQKTVRAFLTIASTSPKWFTMTSDSRTKPVVSNITLSGSSSSPRVDAVLTNASVTALTDVPVVVIVHDTQGEVIAASRTILPTIPAQGQATATFTWNSAFAGVPAEIDVLPVIALP
ncbi:MAG: hypothetical protein ACYCZZ_03570 [Minisyncoccota bacterium]